MPEPHVLLQLRAAWTHGGGTWALPGGALDSHEDSVTAAGREASEEAGINSDDYLVRDVFSDNHGPWRYDTVIAHTNGDALGDARQSGDFFVARRLSWSMATITQAGFGNSQLVITAD
jgi:8-oxo-dGTP pyrophosphatase MutT (NUDIX family)